MLILAINPISGRGHARRQARKASQHFSSIGIRTIEVEGNSLLDFRTRFSTELRNDSVTGVIALGGDGFIHEIIQHLVPRNLPLGVIPCGTGNDFARSLGIHQLSFKKQLEVIGNPITKSIDLGLVGKSWFAAIL